MTTFDLWIAMNEDGDVTVSLEDGDSAGEMLSDDYGGYIRRVVKVTIKMEAPVVEDAGTVDVPAAAGNKTTVEVA